MDPTQFYADVAETIQKHVCQLIGVGGDEGTPPFTYTIGLVEKYGFELLVIGLPYHIAGTVLNDIVNSESIVEPGIPTTEFTNLPIMFMQCTVNIESLHADYVCRADRYYSKEVPIMQIVLCDRAGLFPNDPAFDHEYMGKRQPLFCEF